MRGENVGFLLLVVAFTLPPLIRPGSAGPPSPEGEGFGEVELGDCLRKRTGSAGACPRPTKGIFSLFKLLSRNEPGDPLRWWSTARVSGLQSTAAACRSCLSLWERWHGASRDGEGFLPGAVLRKKASPWGEAGKNL